MDTKARMHIFIYWSFILDPVSAIEKRSISQNCNFCSRYQVLNIMPKFGSALPLTPSNFFPSSQFGLHGQLLQNRLLERLRLCRTRPSLLNLPVSSD